MAFQSIRVQTESLSADKLLFFVFVLCVFFLLIQIALILTSNSKLPAQIPLFYSLPWGEKELASKVWLWILPLLSFGTMFVNFSIGLFFCANNIFLKRTLFLGALVVAVLSLIDTLKIIGLIA